MSAAERSVDAAVPAPSCEAVARTLVAEDPVTRELCDIARSVARSGVTVLLTGESGSGKEVFARLLHTSSPRAARPFVAVNCAAIPQELLEATLFGWEPGAFTGAVRGRKGKFEQAQGGTLLLDEISEMHLPLQAKLLRVLQERELERVGAGETVPLDVRIIATANRDLAAMVAAGTFRQDLYYRLNVFPLEVAPLRARRLDIVPLARHFAAEHASRAHRTPWVLAPDAEARLLSHDWPGNVRELENVVQRATILAPGDVLRAADIRFDAVSVGPAAPPVRAPAAHPPEAESLDMRALERRHIIETLVAVKGSRKLAVARLGISERTLRYKLAEYRKAGLLPEF